MPEPVWGFLGVIVGAVIASVAPVITLIYNHRRWKREKKLDYLISERKRLEKAFTDILDHIDNEQNLPMSQIIQSISNFTGTGTTEAIMSLVTNVLLEETPEEQGVIEYWTKVHNTMMIALLRIDEEIDKLLT